MPKEPTKSPNSKEIFAYFAQLAIATIRVYSGDFKQGLAMIA